VYDSERLNCFGRSPTGRAIRYNALFVTSQSISTTIPNAENGIFEFQVRRFETIFRFSTSFSHGIFGQIQWLLGSKPAYKHRRVGK
jgi:hypothetical protein